MWEAVAAGIACVGALGAAWVAYRSSRRLNAQAAGEKQDARILGLHEKLALEQDRRLDLEREVARLERRVDRLEEQVRSLGYVPVNGD
jgi:ubiquinone biosynthesis protein UbiJ